MPKGIEVTPKKVWRSRLLSKVAFIDSLAFCPVHRTWGVKLVNIDPVKAEIIRLVVTNNWMGSSDYMRRQKVNPFLQGYDYARPGEWVYVEFWTDNIQNIREYCEYMESQLEDPARYSLVKDMYFNANGTYKA